MSPFKLDFRTIGAGLALSMLIAVPLSTHAAFVTITLDRTEATPRSETLHRHGPPGKRWLHRYAHPVPEPAVQSSIRPRQYGPPSMRWRSRIHHDTTETMRYDVRPPRGDALRGEAV